MTRVVQVSREVQASKPSDNAVLATVLADVAKQCEINLSQIEDLYPCTPLQHGLFVLSLASDGLYVAQHTFRLQKNIDKEKLKNAWNTVILRNPILRTRLVAMQTRVLQLVLKDWLPDWADFTDLSTYLATDRKNPMEYGQPLLRLAISPTHLVWTAHHSIYDGYSIELMLADIATAYVGDAPSVRPPFRHFVKNIQLANKTAESKSFWISQVSAKDALSFPSLQPTHRPRPDSTIEHDSSPLISGSSGVTAATLIQAAWALVLSSQVSSSTILYGTILNGRNINVPGIDKIMGPTLATVPVCVSIDYNLTVAQYLQSRQKSFADMIPHVHVGLQTIKELNPEAAKNCEFQNLLAVQFVEHENSVLSYEHLLSREEGNASVDFAGYPFTLQCFFTPSGKMKSIASFDSRIIHATRMRGLLFQLEHVIHELRSTDPGTTLREINLVSPKDLNQIELWNQKPEGSTGFALDEINKQFIHRPNSTAICAWDGEISYSKLNDVSSRLARYLTTKFGIGPEVIVPVCFERSFWMTVAVVAIMKTGAAFSLLDPVYPMKRLENIIELTKAKVVLVSRTCRAMFTHTAADYVVLDDSLFESDDSTAVATSSASDISTPCSEWLSVGNAMYVVFTSGSTGQPKGVVITFGSYYAGAMAHIPYYELGPQSRNLSFGSPAFDLCIQEMVSTLMVGGCLCVPSDNDRLGGITNVIQSMNVNLASFTPSFARQIRPEDVPSLKRLALVGEALPQDQIDAWADELCLMNSYGPSECSVISTINKKVTKSTIPTNIGPVIVGSSWIVDPDDHDRLLPIGATGELLIEGPLLGRGYLNAPEKTAENFVENALRTLGPENRTSRFYKTGDLVRYDVDGSLIYEGRKDTQCKIRGQRVEIGEVEYHVRKMFPNSFGVAVELSKHDDVAELVAFISCDALWKAETQDPGELVTLLSNANIRNASDVKSRLRGALPHHMVPNRYHLLQTLPVLPSGKLDRKQLQQEILNPSGSPLVLRESETELAFIDEGNDIALKLSEKIATLSGARNIESAPDLYGRDLNLSELGFDSIQLMGILTFIRKEYDVKLSVAVLYDEKLTTSGLAKIVSNRQTGIADHDREQVVDLLKEVRNLYDTFLEPSETPDKAANTVFLTGATGYLGSQILKQLVNNSSVQKVVVHVRAQTVEKALERIVHAATLGRWWSASYLARIECWPGDLAATKLGLLPEQWRILTGDCYPSERIHCIIHNGAAVQWQAPYSTLKAANVNSTIELLTAVRQWSVPGSFTYVSGGRKKEPDMDLKSYAIEIQNATGYSQTKFVAEQLTAKFAASQSLHNISIVRPGLIIGTEKEGIPNTDDFLWRLVQSCASIGGYPADDQDFWQKIADVEEVATSVIASNLSPEQADIPKTWHIDTGLIVKDFWNIVKEELNQDLKPLSGEDFVQAVKSLVNAEDGHTFQPLVAMLQGSTFSLGHPRTSEPAKSDVRVYPALRKNLQTLLDIGYIRGACEGGETTFTQRRLPERSGIFGRSGVMKAR